MTIRDLYEHYPPVCWVVFTFILITVLAVTMAIFTETTYTTTTVGNTITTVKGWQFKRV